MSENKHTPGHIAALSDQFIFHPASRSIDEIEMAGEIMRDLLEQRDELLAALDGMLFIDADNQRGNDDEDVCCEVRQARSTIASVKGGAA